MTSILWSSSYTNWSAKKYTNTNSEPTTNSYLAFLTFSSPIFTLGWQEARHSSFAIASELLKGRIRLDRTDSFETHITKEVQCYMKMNILVIYFLIFWNPKCKVNVPVHCSSYEECTLFSLRKHHWWFFVQLTQSDILCFTSWYGHDGLVLRTGTNCQARCHVNRWGITFRLLIYITCSCFKIQLSQNK